MKYRHQLRFFLRAMRHRVTTNRGLIRYIRRHLITGDTAVDFGANQGEITYWMNWYVGRREGRVFAFQSNRTLAQHLNQVAEAFDWPHVTISDSHHSSSYTQRSVLTTKDADGRSLERDDQAQSSVVSLDDYFARKPGRPVRLIRCNSPGDELALFQGAESILREDRPALLFSCERQHHSSGQIEHVFEYLSGLGYRGEFIMHNGIWLRPFQVPLTMFRSDRHQQPGSRLYIRDFTFTARNPKSRAA